MKLQGQNLEHLKKAESLSLGQAPLCLLPFQDSKNISLEVKKGEEAWGTKQLVDSE